MEFGCILAAPLGFFSNFKAHQWTGSARLSRIKWKCWCSPKCSFQPLFMQKNHKIFEESTAVNTEAINLKRLNLKVVIFSSFFSFFKPVQIRSHDHLILRCRSRLNVYIPFFKKHTYKTPGELYRRVSQVLQCEALQGCYFPQCIWIARSKEPTRPAR